MNLGPVFRSLCVAGVPGWLIFLQEGDEGSSPCSYRQQRRTNESHPHRNAKGSGDHLKCCAEYKLINNPPDNFGTSPDSRVKGVAVSKCVTDFITDNLLRRNASGADSNRLD